MTNPYDLLEVTIYDNMLRARPVDWDNKELLGTDRQDEVIQTKWQSTCPLCGELIEFDIVHDGRVYCVCMPSEAQLELKPAANDIEIIRDPDPISAENMQEMAEEMIEEIIDPIAAGLFDTKGFDTAKMIRG